MHTTGQDVVTSRSANWSYPVTGCDPKIPETTLAQPRPWANGPVIVSEDQGPWSFCVLRFGSSGAGPSLEGVLDVPASSRASHAPTGLCVSVGAVHCLRRRWFGAGDVLDVPASLRASHAPTDCVRLLEPSLLANAVVQALQLSGCSGLFADKSAPAECSPPRICTRPQAKCLLCDASIPGHRANVRVANIHFAPAIMAI
jgi:hypothetical protein